MDITISIVNWNTIEELDACLKSVLAQTGADVEVIVVDNASSDGSVDFVSSRFPQIKLIANDKNVGFSRAQNQSIKQSHGRYVMLLNPDSVIPETDVLAKLIAFADANPKVGIVGPKIENPDGSLQYSARRFPTIGAGLFRRTPLGKLFPNNKFVKSYIISDWAHDEVRDVDWVSGAALMIRRETIEDIGTLDPDFYMYCEDVDWAYRAGKSGWRVCYYPMSRVIHQIGAASDKAAIRMIYHFHRSMFRFFRKHYARRWKRVATPAIFAAICLRAAFFMMLAKIPLSKKARARGERLVK